MVYPLNFRTSASSPVGFVFLACLFAFASSAATTKPVGPLAPAQARSSIELEPGLDADLIAAEPLVKSPCAMCWDERGRMFVAENVGYPNGGPNGEPAGSIALLEDTQGTGIPDRRTVFADKLTFPNGVMPWRGGLIVTCAPEVLYLKDTTGDGHADVREVLLTGFSTKGSTQLRVNCPILGPDGWVYLSGGLAGGIVYSPKHPERKLDSGRSDVKFKPDTGEIELVDGKGQFGHTFDDAGHRFVCMNRIQVEHAPLPAKYLARNKSVTSPGVLQSCPDLILNTLLVHSQNSGSRVFPISANLTTADSHAGTYTAACAVHIARGDALPSEYVGVAWSCEPTGNLARCDKLVPMGGSFHAVRMKEDSEAFRSRDDWCRPVFLCDGPDGSLYICDMYRRVIEHPDYLPEEIKKNGDFEQGKGMGRIWRVHRTDLRAGQLADRARDRFAAMKDAGAPKLVEQLCSADGWTRDTASRLIAEAGLTRESPFAQPLAALIAGKGVSTATRLTAMYLLADAGTLTADQLVAALGDRDTSVREVAVKLAETRLHNFSDLTARTLALADDPDVHVRYAVALAAGEVNNAFAVAQALGKLARRDSDDKWFRAAILTSAPLKSTQWPLLESLVKSSVNSAGEEDFLRDLSRCLNDGADDEAVSENMSRMLEASAQAGYPTQAALLLGFADRDLLEKTSDPAVAALKTRILDESNAIAKDSSAPSDRRLKAITLLGAVSGREGALDALIAPTTPAELSAAAARALAQPRHLAAVPGILAAARWQKYPPTLRAAVLSNLIGHPELAPPLLSAIESGAVPAGALNPTQKEWLQKLKDDSQRTRAAALFAGGGVATDRMKTYEESRAAVMALKGVATHGQKVFRDNCTTCHRLDREGVAVGPDLLDIRSLPKETMLLHIVIPELEIAPNFTCYNCVTTDGRTITGILIADDPGGITLRQPLAIDETIGRDKIKSLEASKLSLMPQGLEKAIPPQDMADLLAYLRGEK